MNTDISLMDIVLLGLLFSLIVSLIIGIITFYKKISPAAEIIQKDSNRFSVKEDSMYNVVIQKMICKLKHDLNSSKITICRFHNGGNYVNGLPMKKFTMTHETEGGTSEDMMGKCVAILNSRYPTAFAQLATLDEYCIADINDCPDLGLKRDMKRWGFNSTNMFLIRQFDEKEDGFITVNFNETHVMMKEERHKIEDQIPRVMGLLNMQHDFLKGPE